MRDSRPLFAQRTYALAVAVVLSPAFLQVGDCQRGNTELSSLEFEVDGGPNLITGFDTGIRSYDVSTSGSTVTVRAQAVYGVNDVSWQWLVGTTTIGSGPIGTGGGELTLPVPIPDGQSVLRVAVKSNEVGATASGYYTIHIEQTPPPRYSCDEAGLLQAISDGGGPHYFDCQGPTTVETESLIIINSDVILDGQGNLTVSGQGTHQLFVIWSTVEFIGMTLTDAATSSSGGAIRNEGTLTLTRCTVSGNTAILGGGINNRGELTLRSTIVSGNSTPTDGNYGAGGISNNGGTLTVIDSTIFGNASGSGGGINTDGVTTIVNSTISGNTAGYLEGGGIANSRGDLTLINSTVSGNYAELTGNGISSRQSTGTASLTLVNTTVSGNTGSDLGTAIANFGQATSLTFLNSVIDGSCYIESDLVVPLASYTIESPGETCSLAAGQGNQMNVTAGALGLGPLQDNGGGTLTQVPSASSVAVDRVPTAECIDFGGVSLETDQRGNARPVGPRCDAGAAEGDCPYCNDFNECTANSCDSITLACIHTPVPDGSQCGLGAYTCSGGLCGSCIGVTCSDDASDCTADVCGSETGACNPPLPDGTPCSTDNGTCLAGVCEGGVVRISAEGAIAANPVVAVDTQGRAHALWEQEHGSIRISRGATHTPGVGWTEEFSFGIGGVNPQIAAAPNGHVVAVWADASGSVYGRSFKNDAWDTPKRLDLSVVVDDPHVAVDWNGNATAVWTHGGELSATQYSPIGGWRLPGTVEYNLSSDLTPGGASVPQVAVDAHGNAIAVWLDDADDVQAVQYTPGRGWSIVRQIGQEIADAREPEIAMDPEGNAMVIWQDGSDIYRNYFSRFGAQSAGDWRGAELAENQGSTAFWGDVAMHGVGDAMMLWAQSSGIYAKRFVDQGYTHLPPERIDPDEGPCYVPKIAMDPRGNAVAVWSTSGGEDSLWSRVYRVNQGWDPAWKVHTTSADLRNYEVAIDNNGNAMIVWEEDQSIWAQDFNFGPPDWKFECSEDGIRAAIAEGGGTHQFDCGVATTVLTDNEIVIDTDVVLDGEGLLTVDGGQTHRVFSVSDTSWAHLARLTITGGYSGSDGGGIQVAPSNTYQTGWLSLTNSIVTNNHAAGRGGGMSNHGWATVTNTTISNNTAGGGGGGIFNFDDDAFSFSGQLLLGNSTVMENAAPGELGGGILNTFGYLKLENSTVYYNSAAYGGGIATLNDLVGGQPDATLLMRRSTISGNVVENTDAGSAIWNNARLYWLKGNIIQGDCVTPTAPEVSWYNIESPGNTCQFSTSTHNLYNVSMTELHLWVLQAHAGPTFTVPPALPSVAIDRFYDGSNIICGGSDQRGVPRPQRGSACDVGAVEVQDVEFSVDLPSGTNLTLEGPSVPYTVTIDNHNGPLYWVRLNTRISQGTRYREAGQISPSDCGDPIPGPVYPGICTFDFSIAASNAGAGSGTLVPGAATARFDLELWSRLDELGELLEVLDSVQVPVTLVASQ